MKRLLLIVIGSLGLIWPGMSQAVVPKLVVERPLGTNATDALVGDAKSGAKSYEYFIKLPSKPSTTVTVTTATSGEAPLTVTAGSALIFTPDNFATAQKAVIKEGEIKDKQTGKIVFAASGYGSLTVNYSVGAATTNKIIKPSDIDPNDLPGSGITNVGALLPKIIGWFLTLIALAAFASLLYSGFLYITAGGDTGRAELARKNIVWALSGIVITLLAYVLVVFVGNWVSGLGDDSTAGGGHTNNGQLVVRGRDGSSLIEQRINDVTAPFTAEAYIRLAAKPSSTIITTAYLEGDLPINLSVNQLNFTPENWDKDQLLTLIYGGNGQSGESARLVLRTDDRLAYSVPFILGLANLPLFWVSDNELHEITEVTLSDPATQLSTEFRGVLDGEPGSNGTITISSSGDFALQPSPSSLQFDDGNWSVSQPFSVTYAGNGQRGQTASMNFSAAGTVIHSIKFIIP